MPEVKEFVCGFKLTDLSTTSEVMNLRKEIKRIAPQLNFLTLGNKVILKTDSSRITVNIICNLVTLFEKLVVVAKKENDDYVKMRIKSRIIVEYFDDNIYDMSLSVNRVLGSCRSKSFEGEDGSGWFFIKDSFVKEDDLTIGGKFILEIIFIPKTEIPQSLKGQHYLLEECYLEEAYGFKDGRSELSSSFE